jgi:hypothetical protein
MKELKENSEKSKEARRLRLLVIIVLIVLLLAYLVVALGFIIPAIPISLISEYNKELNGYINVAKAWDSLYNPLLTDLNLFASSTSQGSKDFQLNKITKVKKKKLTFSKSDFIPKNTTSYSTVYFNSTSFQFFNQKTVKLPSSILISLQYSVGGKFIFF